MPEIVPFALFLAIPFSISIYGIILMRQLRQSDAELAELRAEQDTAD